MTKEELDRLESLREKIAKSVSIYEELAPLDAAGKPQWGIRKYSEPFTDAEWRDLLSYILAARKLDALERAIDMAEPWWDMEELQTRAAELLMEDKHG